MRYIKKIDSLRTFAVLSVVLSHWIPKTSKIIPFGAIGVNWFFVISGFLITRILLTEKQKAGEPGITSGLLLKNFIVRRTLRIFPVYYLALLLYYIVGNAAGSPLFHDNIGYFLTYTSNFYFFKINAWDGYVSHLWSLSVEEQFYLVWPFLMLFLNRKHSYFMIIASIAIGFIFPFIIPGTKGDVLTPSCMSSLGLGALLSYYVVYKEPELVKYRMQILYTGLVALLIFAMGIKFKISHFPYRFLFSLFAVVTLMYCLKYYRKIAVLDKVLDNSLLVSLGKISYGLYLFHNLMPLFWRTYIESHFTSVLHSAGIAETSAVAVIIIFIVKFILLVTFCSLSFRLFEMPIQSLKKHFATKSSQPTS